MKNIIIIKCQISENGKSHGNYYPLFIGTSASFLSADLHKDILLDISICNNCGFQVKNAFFLSMSLKCKEKKKSILLHINFGHPKTYNS